MDYRNAGSQSGGSWLMEVLGDFAGKALGISVPLGLGLFSGSNYLLNHNDIYGGDGCTECTRMATKVDGLGFLGYTRFITGGDDSVQVDKTASLGAGESFIWDHNGDGRADKVFRDGILFESGDRATHQELFSHADQTLGQEGKRFWPLMSRNYQQRHIPRADGKK